MTIRNHRLVFEPYSWTVNLRKGDAVDITDLKSELLLDGSSILDTQL
jgi:hypothetical protein